MPEPHTLLLFAGASIVLLVVPGPAVLYVVTRGAVQGHRAGVVSVLGVGLGNFSHALAAGALGRRLRGARFESRLRRASGVVYLGLGLSTALAEGRADRA